MTTDPQTEARAIARYAEGDIYWMAEYGRPLGSLSPSEIGEFVLYTDHATALAAKDAELAAWIRSDAKQFIKLNDAIARAERAEAQLAEASRSAGEWEDMHRELLDAVLACADPEYRISGLHPGPERDELESVINAHKSVHKADGPYASNASRSVLRAQLAEKNKALDAIASCTSHHPDDIVAIARRAREQGGK